MGRLDHTACPHGSLAALAQRQDARPAPDENVERRLRGNLPEAFTHALPIEWATTLATRAPGRWPDEWPPTWPTPSTDEERR